MGVFITAKNCLKICAYLREIINLSLSKNIDVARHYLGDCWCFLCVKYFDTVIGGRVSFDVGIFSEKYEMLTSTAATKYCQKLARLNANEGKTNNVDFFSSGLLF